MSARAKYSVLSIADPSTSTSIDVRPSSDDGKEFGLEHKDNINHHSRSTSDHKFGCLTFIDNWRQATVFISYIGLYLTYGSWIHWHGGKYSPAMMVMSVLLTKFTISLGLFFLFDDTPKGLITTIMNNRKSLLLFSFPAMAYATTDTLTVVCLRNLDVSTFSVLYNVRVVFMLILFQRFIGIKLTSGHWIAMGFVVSACIMKEAPTMLSNWSSTSSGDGDAFINRFKTIVLLLLMAQLAAFAAVYNEKLLKEQKLSLNLQNMALYFWAGVTATCYTIIFPMNDRGNILEDITSGAEWKAIWSYPINVAVLLSALYGLTTSYFIKSLNNVVREMACAIHIVGTIPVNYFLFQYSIRITDFFAVLSVITGVTIFNRNPLK